MTTTIRLEPELEKRINRLSERTGRSKAYYLRTMITSEAVAELEWEEDILQRARDVREGRASTVSEAEVRAQLGLKD